MFNFLTYLKNYLHYDALYLNLYPNHTLELSFLNMGAQVTTVTLLNDKYMFLSSHFGASDCMFAVLSNKNLYGCLERAKEVRLR